MTKDDLKQLKAIRKEIELLQKEVRKASRMHIVDSVTGSDVNFPYSKRTITIEGADLTKASKLHKKLGRKLDELQDKLCDMEEWLDNVGDSEVRSILRLRFRNGLTWEQVAAHMGHQYTGELVRQKYHRFFNKL